MRDAPELAAASTKPLRSPLSISEMVEAGGIEPPSEDRQEMAATRLFRDSELAVRAPADARRAAGIL